MYLFCAIRFGYLLVLWFDLLECQAKAALVFVSRLTTNLGVSAYSSGRDYLIYLLTTHFIFHVSCFMFHAHHRKYGVPFAGGNYDGEWITMEGPFLLASYRTLL